MNIKKLLKEAKIPERYYYLNTKLTGDKYSRGDILCISVNNNKWEVYYTERGSKFDVKEFDSETGACEYFFNTCIKPFKSNPPF